MAHYLAVRSEKGQGSAEYLILLAIIAILVIAGVRYFASEVTDEYALSARKIASLETGNAERQLEVNSGRRTRRDKQKEEITTETEPGSASIVDSADDDLTTTGSDTQAAQELRMFGDPSDELAPIDSLKLDVGTLTIIFVLACVAGIYVLFWKRGSKRGRRLPTVTR